MPPPRAQTLYFAYGSNLGLEQMAKRCPESRYIGHARLPDFRWQINERGYANVVPEPGGYVEGLCYLLSPEDEARLDRSEGVPAAYEKMHYEVEVFTASVTLVGRKVAEILGHSLANRQRRVLQRRPDLAGPSPHTSTPSRSSTRHGRVLESQEHQDVQVGSGEGYANEAPGDSQADLHKHQNRVLAQAKERDVVAGERVKALVYQDHWRTKEHIPQDEYVKRMNRGISDAKMLGVSEEYINDEMMPRIYVW